MHDGKYLFVPGDNSSVILPMMGERAAGAYLSAIGMIDKIPAAPIAQNIERAVAEQAVKVLRVCPLVAGEILARPVGEKLTVLCGHGSSNVDKDIFMILHPKSIHKNTKLLVK